MTTEKLPLVGLYLNEDKSLALMIQQQDRSTITKRIYSTGQLIGTLTTNIADLGIVSFPVAGEYWPYREDCQQHHRRLLTLTGSFNQSGDQQALEPGFFGFETITGIATGKVRDAAVDELVIKRLTIYKKTHATEVSTTVESLHLKRFEATIPGSMKNTETYVKRI